MRHNLLISSSSRVNPHQHVSETSEERRHAKEVPQSESGLKNQRYRHPPSSLYQLIARERTGMNVSDHITRTFNKLKVERYVDAFRDHIFSSSKFPLGSAMSLSTVALTTSVSDIHHISSDTDRLEPALPRCLREWNLSDSRSAAAATGWGKGKRSASLHIPAILSLLRILSRSLYSLALERRFPHCNVTDGTGSQTRMCYSSISMFLSESVFHSGLT